MKRSKTHTHTQHKRPVSVTGTPNVATGRLFDNGRVRTICHPTVWVSGKSAYNATQGEKKETREYKKNTNKLPFADPTPFAPT